MSRLRALPTGFWLAALVLLGGAAWSIEALRLENWVVQTDELQYVRNAMSVAQDGAIVPTIHGEHYGSFSLFAFLMAPFYALFDTGTAFDLAHVAGAFAMASAAFPAYLLARELTESRLAALLAAALAISLPWFSLVTMLRTELVAYPAFLWAVFAIQRSVAEPSTQRDLLALVALGLALLARTQLLALAFAYPLAILLHETGYALAGRPRTSLREALKRSLTRHPLVAAAVGAGAALALSGVAASALGSYEVVGRRDLLPDGVWDQARWQLAIVVTAGGCIPFILGFGWLVETVFRPLTREAHAYASVALTAGAAVVIQAAGFVVQFVPGQNYQDRYFFYVAPLILIAMVGWLADRRRLWTGAAVGAVAFLWLASRHYFAPFSVYSYSPASAFNRVWYGRADQLTDFLGLARNTQEVVKWGGFSLGVLAALGARFVPRRAALVAVCSVVLAFGVLQAGYIIDKIIPTQASNLSSEDWVDEGRTGDARVGVLAAPIGRVWLKEHVVNDASPWWNLEFWNKSIDRAYIRGFGASPFPHLPLSVDENTGLLRAPEPLRPEIVSLAGRPDIKLRGRVIARSRQLELIRLARPHAADWAVEGLIAGNNIRRLESARLTAFPAPGRRPRGVRFTIVLQAPPVSVPRQRFAVSAEGVSLRGELAPEAVAERSLSVCVRRRPANVYIGAGPAHIGLRIGEIGLRLVTVRSRPDPAACA